MSKDPTLATLHAKLAVHSSWAQTADRAARTAPARAAALRRFEDQVDPDRSLPAEERQRRAESARRAHMARLAYLAAKARKARS